jgi:hypothetical protein
MNLLDQNIKNYIFKWEGGSTHGSFKFIPEIQNEDQESLGKIKLEGHWLSKKFCLYDMNNPILYVKEYLGSGGRNYNIKNTDDSLLGTVHAKFSLSTILTMKNTKGDEILFLDAGRVEALGGKWREINSKENQIAKFDVNQERIKKGWLKYNYYNTCRLQILDLKFDRKNLLGMFICCMVNILKRLEPTGEGSGE